MRKHILGWVWVVLVCVTLTVACSPYETQDPTGARVIMLRDQSDQEPNATTPDASTTVTETPSEETP